MTSLMFGGLPLPSLHEDSHSVSFDPHKSLIRESVVSGQGSSSSPDGRNEEPTSHGSTVVA